MPSAAKHPWIRTRLTGLWLVSRFRDVRRVLLDPSALLPDNAQYAVAPLPLAVLRVLARAGFTLPPAPANNGTAGHAGLRRVVTRFFNVERVAAAARRRRPCGRSPAVCRTYASRRERPVRSRRCSACCPSLDIRGWPGPGTGSRPSPYVRADLRDGRRRQVDASAALIGRQEF
ncbi:hypothetical protein [Streptomyces sp. F001]|uniref:hypothetical protein n=1 Tax=Streptomyces sp. F001 TaxID=1510026 RepID=UPI0032083A50